MGDFLTENETLNSLNTKYFAGLQGDGNLALYANSNSSYPLWSTNYPITKSFQRPFKMTLTDNEGLVVKDIKNNSVWNIPLPTQVPTITLALFLHNDGNLVVYNRSKMVLWRTNLTKTA
jgi:hypothetical protein